MISLIPRHRRSFRFLIDSIGFQLIPDRFNVQTQLARGLGFVVPG
jgi:hypothetical protein